MFFVAGVLAVLAGLFYAASNHEIGSLSVTMCTYGPMFCDNAAAYTWPNSILFWNKGPGTLPAGTKVVITIQPTGQKITYILTQDWDVKTGVFLPVPIETSQPIHCSAEIFGIDRKSVPHP